MTQEDPRWQLAAWGRSIELLPQQAAFLKHPAQLLQWAGGLATGGSTAVLMGAFLAAWRGRALIVCDRGRFQRTMEGSPPGQRVDGFWLSVMSCDQVFAHHESRPGLEMRFNYIGVLGPASWELVQVLLALLAPGGIVRARGDRPCPHLGELFQGGPP